MIEMRGVTKSFGDLPVLTGIDLQVEEGEVCVLIGPSGSGKSTLIRCINGLTLADEGEITVQGREVTAGNLSTIRTHTGMVFQHFHLFPHMTALENITEGPVQVKGVDPAEAEDAARALLERVGLPDKADSYPSQLSGGQKQRIAIARALAMEPAVLLFDEVTSALDPEMVGEVLGVMQDLAAEGITMIVVTHEMQFARRVAHRVCFLDEGRVVEEGTPSEIFDECENERVRGFLNALTGAPAQG